MKEIAVALVQRNKEFLIGQRKSGDCAGLWEFPGGKREIGETLSECCIRECLEETGLPIQVENLYWQTIYQYPSEEVSLSFFKVTVSSKDMEKVKKDWIWVPREKLKCYAFCPANEPLLQQLQNEKA